MMNRIKVFQKYIDNAFIGNTLLIAGVTFAFLFFSGFFGIQYTIDSKHFANGVTVDDIDVSGLTYKEADRLLSVRSQERLGAVQITLAYGDEKKSFDSDDLGVTLNKKEVLDKAYSYNKNETDSVGQRFNKTVELSKGADYKVDMAVDEDKLRRTVEQYAAPYQVNAVDATVSFDKDTSGFTYTEEQYGTRIDVDSLVSKIRNMLDAKDYSVLQVSGAPEAPNVTRNGLKENTVLTAAYKTLAANDANRNVNIGLICKAVDGLEIKPGETLSLNGLTGQRTAEKGYKQASAISDGILVNDFGGGICQLAGTLYNAALLADLQIIERVRHTWPSKYLPIGQDSTLNWNNKDLKIKNIFTYSIYISAKFENQWVTVRIYGPPLKDGVSIKIQNDIFQTIPPAKTEIRYTNELPIGARHTARAAANGYKVNVYRIFLQNGVEINRELISSDYYPALNKIVLIGKNSLDK